MVIAAKFYTETDAWFLYFTLFCLISLLCPFCLISLLYPILLDFFTLSHFAWFLYFAPFCLISLLCPILHDFFTLSHFAWFLYFVPFCLISLLSLLIFFPGLYVFPNYSRNIVNSLVKLKPMFYSRPWNTSKSFK